jgi:hypothetical protein
MENPLNWTFLNETLGRWFLFLLFLIVALGLWGRILAAFGKVE